MSQPARKPDHAIHDQFTGRWSPRAFADTPVSEAEMKQLFEAARWSPSASNNQPWRFAYGLRGDASFEQIVAGLKGFNTGWAQKASALIVVASAKSVEKDGEKSPNAWHAFDTGAAWAHLALQAQDMGLVTHAMGGFEAEVLAKSLKLPEDYEIHAVVAVGHRGDKADLPEALQAREAPSQRRPISETVARGGFV
jgi:nitroreductase